MSDLKISVSDGITPELNRIAGQIKNTRPLMAALGKQLEVDLRKHFRERDAQPNARGWPKKHFWRKEVSTNTALTEVADTRAVVTIASPAFVHKVYGGTVTPKRGKALTIPLSPEAYKAGSASLFPRKLFCPKGKRVLMDEAGSATAARDTDSPEVIAFRRWRDASHAFLRKFLPRADNAQTSAKPSHTKLVREEVEQKSWPQSSPKSQPSDDYEESARTTDQPPRESHDS